MLKITPDEVPTDLPEVDSTTLETEANLSVKRGLILEGKNMFVTLRDGAHKVGRIEWASMTEFTVGNSDPIPLDSVVSAREV